MCLCTVLLLIRISGKLDNGFENAAVANHTDNVVQRTEGVATVQQQNNGTCLQVPVSRRRDCTDTIRVSYLLVSPVLPPLAWLLGGVRVVGMAEGQNGTATTSSVTAQGSSTLAIIGERDGFTSAKKVRMWARENGAEVAEVPEAGHFWREEGAVEGLMERVERWICTVRVRTAY